MRRLAPLVLLVLLLPFEPMAPLVRVLGLEVSHLELFAFVLLVLAALASRGEEPAAGAPTSPTKGIPLAAAAFVLLLAYVLSTAFSEGSAILPLKFTLRMTAAVVAFLLTSSALSRRPRFDALFLAFAAAGAFTALVALLEAARLPLAQHLVAPFREHPFEVGGRARVAATFAYPNTTGGFLALCLPPTMSFLVRSNASLRSRSVSFVVSLGVFIAVLLTYSRGALLGAAAASLFLWWRLRGVGEASSPRLLRLQSAFVLVGLGFLVAEPSFRWRTSSEGDREWYRAELAPADDELHLEPGELSTARVSVKNVGKLVWSSTEARPIHLSYRWFRPGREGHVKPLGIEGERTALAAPVAPGEQARLFATVRAPREPGTYLLVWDLVHEHTTWFSEKVGLGAPVRVLVGDVAPVTSLRPDEVRRSVEEKTWRPGRAELWAIALRLFSRHPLLGVGPDNFRWLYGAVAGRESSDHRLFANSLYLELLATVGLFGFLSFAALIGGALLGLHRGPADIDSAVLGASLAGFLVHGLFDYLLAFTPIYLALFLLLGASSAWIAREGAS